jgi:hypothetical protein
MSDGKMGIRTIRLQAPLPGHYLHCRHTKNSGRDVRTLGRHVRIAVRGSAHMTHVEVALAKRFPTETALECALLRVPRGELGAHPEHCITGVLLRLDAIIVHNRQGV